MSSDYRPLFLLVLLSGPACSKEKVFYADYTTGAGSDTPTYSLYLDGEEITGIRRVAIGFYEDIGKCVTSDGLGFGSDREVTDEPLVRVILPFEDEIGGEYDIATWMREEHESVEVQYISDGLNYYADSGTIKVTFPEVREQVTLEFYDLHLNGYVKGDKAPSREMSVSFGTLTTPVLVGCNIVPDTSDCGWISEAPPFTSKYCIAATAAFPESTYVGEDQGTQ